MVIVLAIILMLLSTRGRVESFSPESMIGTIEKTAELFIRERLLDEGESLQRVEVVESNYSTVEWGEYTYDATIQYRTLSREEILFTRWKYSVKTTASTSLPTPGKTVRLKNRSVLKITGLTIRSQR